MEPEAFYNLNKDADCIIYIYSLGGRPETLNAFLERSELLQDFKAVQNGKVWGTTPDFFQSTDTSGLMIADIYNVLSDTGDEEGLKYLFKLD